MIHLIITLMFDLIDVLFRIIVICGVTIFIFKSLTGYDTEISFFKKPRRGLKDMPGACYPKKELQDRVRLMNECDELLFSDQYGMLFILNKEGQILLNITNLGIPSEEKKGKKNKS